MSNSLSVCGSVARIAAPAITFLSLTSISLLPFSPLFHRSYQAIAKPTQSSDGPQDNSRRSTFDFISQQQRQALALGQSESWSSSTSSQLSG